VTKNIYIYSPSGAVRDKAAFKRGVARLKALGHTVEIDADALKSHMRFAGEDATRIAAIHRAAASEADVALITRGGYGLTRLQVKLTTQPSRKESSTARNLWDSATSPPYKTRCWHKLDLSPGPAPR
jgi:muramoyltetrapeptide carboxypeptidase LdcA involved in peptidoglycan recycling